MPEPRVRWIAATDPAAVADTLAQIGVSPEGTAVMAPKARGQALLIRGEPAGVLLGLKQALLRHGADLALAAGAGGCPSETPGAPETSLDAVILGSDRGIRRACAEADPALSGLTRAIIACLDRAGRGPRILRAGRHRFPLGGRTLVLGILNRTPDSFTDRGKHYGWDTARRRAEQMLAEGVDIIEVGGQTAQPNKPQASVADEIERVAPFVDQIRSDLGCPIAVDTYRYEVAAAAVAAGACLINDISGLADDRLADLAAESGAALVVMHIRHRPRIDFHQLEHRWAVEYGSLFAEVREFLIDGARRAEARGVPADRLILDPGLGFDKLYFQDVAIVRRLAELRAVGYPVLLATSHKNYLGEAIGEPGLDPLGPTAAAVVWGVAQGADLVRVHDTAFLRPVLRLAEIFAGRTDPVSFPGYPD